MSYLLDANVFIQAKNLHYGFEFCPAFWDWLIVAHRRGLVHSIEKVGDELSAGGDALAEWAEALGSAFFLRPDRRVAQSFPVVSAWIAGNGYSPAAQNTFLQVADYWLVSHAHAHGLVVVTHERAAPTPNRIKIPNVCVGLDVKCMTPFEMLRFERARFVLQYEPHDSG